ncbi:zinc finger protein-like protein [Rhynchospora pubera]|uniref:Zinc finger protein-like protein n=1 Tax=Rhynchospora pubera TaxID=906938 RepID=A0AAV8DN14_9POAL|nr:zinc finger protein-like protein [Rhynchospora pubera]
MTRIRQVKTKSSTLSSSKPRKSQAALMATPLVMNSIDASSSSPPSQSMLSGGDAASAEERPILIFLCFHKAIRSELDKIHRAAVALATDGARDVDDLADRCRFLSNIYNHHCQAEDAVIFPALDLRVKNVAQTYSLEHAGEKDLFEHLFELLQQDLKKDSSLRRELASCTGAIQTSLTQHMSKEEEQVFPLLIDKFSIEEQADLVWQFLCNIPVSMMVEFLPWLAATVSPDEHQDITKCLHKVIPSEKLLQQVIFGWMKGKQMQKMGSKPEDISEPKNSVHGKTGKRKHNEAANVSSYFQPVDEILLWHKAIRSELREIADAARNIQFKGDFSDLSAFNLRLQFIADVCIYHSIAEDQIIFPAVDSEVSFEQEHKEEKSRFNRLRLFIENIQRSGATSSAVDFYAELCSQADQIMGNIDKHFQNEETKVLPIARSCFSKEKQHELMYQSLCVMPLKLLEHTLPWLVSKINDQERSLLLLNIRFGAFLPSETALVSLLSGWACKGRHRDISTSGKFTCIETSSCNCSVRTNSPAGELEDLETSSLCACSRPVKRANFIESSETPVEYREIEKPCCVPGLGLSDLFLGPTTKPLNICKTGNAGPSVYSSLFSFETEINFTGIEKTSRPIDTIFKFHKAIRKDIEYLDIESAKLLDLDEAFVRQFFGRFRMLWGLYKAHSTAEDNIVFPALESKETLHNVSHSYTLDHKQEEELFQNINDSLLELSTLLHETGRSSNDSDWVRRHSELVTQLQGMCKSMRVTLCNHVHREEMELWPLFDKHFNMEEQDKLVGRIIGTTGAEVLQSMLPWVTSAVTAEEQNKIVDTWRQAAKNTMFGDWLDEWWKGGHTVADGEGSSEVCSTSTASECQDEMVEQSNEMFRPGWKDIFRMNQNELEAEIHRLSRTSLDPRKKAYLIQNLMTSRWIAAQQKQEGDEENHGGENIISGCCPSYRDTHNQIYGCEHYKRNCKLVAPCCNKLFTCRFCHDKVSDHTMDRKAVREMMCMQCLKVQQINPTCTTPSCNQYSMAKYYCNICKLFDDERAVYHCPFCNLCRLGKGLGIDFFHCMKCNCCLGLKLVNHKCREKMLETNCPICYDFLFTSSAAVKALPCGHFMHSACFQAYTCSHYTCPICWKSLGDMTVYFGMLDALLAAEVLPEEYRDRCQDILCNDCDKKGRARFHWLYHKCGFCGSYNTRVIKSDTVDCSTSN